MKKKFLNWWKTRSDIDEISISLLIFGTVITIVNVVIMIISLTRFE
uniref:Uncharacterized protein n=1 Tax=Myoviridae sp. ctk6V34 TaxID=2825164 RepID=A0A8S5V3P7_9CAUD|nr:MAG TPA: hypothetical protein [Myoviridae sp. ctk6V34]